MHYLRKTKIICTIGPSTRSVSQIEAMLHAGMNVARINFSHETHKQHGATIDMIRQAEQKSGIPVAILLDTRGPEIRTGIIADGGEIEFHHKRTVILTTEQIVTPVPSSRDEPVRLSVNYNALPQILTRDDHIYIADGIVDLRVLDISGTEITTTVQSGGFISSSKNVNVPGVSLPLPAVSERDAADIRFGLSRGIDFIAASFVRSAADILEIRHLIEQENEKDNMTGNGKACIIAKIENNEGVEQIQEIAEASDGVMIARGDLGIQLPMEQIPLVQKRIIGVCNQIGVPVVTATQMLESMTYNARPTRAEMTDVANAIYDGTDAVMLSGETAVGAHPIESIVTLDRIACAVERSAEFVEQRERLLLNSLPVSSSNDAVAKSSCVLARDIAASCIVIPSIRGNGPRLLARYRSTVPIVAAVASQNQTVIRQLLIHWGVMPFAVQHVRSNEQMLQNAMNSAKENGYVRPNDWVVTVAGLPLDTPVTINTVSAQYMGTVLRRGRRAYGSYAQGAIRIFDDNSREQLLSALSARADSAADDAPNTILVLEQLNKTHIPFLPLVAGVISERVSMLTATEVRMQNPQIVMIEEIHRARQYFSDEQTVQLNGLEQTVYAC